MNARAYLSLRVRDKVFIFTSLMLLSLSSLAAEPDWSAFDTLLKQNVASGTKDGVRLNTVDYAAIRRDPAYQQVLKQVQSYNLRELKTKEEKLAFYINVYNLFAIKMILDHWPIKAIKDAGNIFNSVWKKDIGRLGGRNVSLHYIEHEVLRKMDEPRIHMAIVCASVSCPDLRKEAYMANKLDGQLDEQSTLFLQNSGKGLQMRKNEIDVSKLFKWFDDDFDQYGGVLGFVKKYRQDLPPKIQIDDYLPYNWQLNSKP